MGFSVPLEITYKKPGEPMSAVESARASRKVAVGVVTSNKMQKTIAVRIPRMVRHAQYGKYLRRFTVCKAHDEKQAAGIGDTVSIMETRPLSATKRWRLVEVLARARREKGDGPTGPMAPPSSAAGRPGAADSAS